MYKLKQLLRFLLRLPFGVRLSIVLLCWAPTILFQMAHQSQFYGLFMLPVLLAAWMFKLRGGLLTCALIALQSLIFNTLYEHTIFWPPTAITGYIAGISSIVILATVVGLQRSALETSQRANQQMALAYEQQQQLNQLKENLMLNISHELRTPLTTLHGYLELLQDHDEQLDSAIRTRFVEQALQGCEELLSLTSAMQDAIQIDRSDEKPSCTYINICKIMHDVVDHLSPRVLQDYTITLDVPEELHAWAAPRRTRSVLQHLLTNACKFSPPLSEIMLSVTALNEQYIRVNIKDTGPGIPTNEISLLFGKFVRLKRDLVGPIRGSGLGLYICKQLVESMGGTIRVESSGIAGEGSCFSFTLPRRPGPVVALPFSHDHAIAASQKSLAS